MVSDFTFYIDGVDARTVGLHLQQPLEVSGLVPRVRKVAIDGRNGDLIQDTGAYENRRGRARCFALQQPVDVALTAINNWLLADTDYRMLESSEDPDHFWLARVARSGQLQPRIQTLAPFDIEFDIMPQHFVRDVGQVRLTYAENGTQTIYNPCGGTSEPLIQVIGKSSGQAKLRVNQKAVTIRQFVDPGRRLFIDSQSMELYTVTSSSKNPQDANVLCLDFPTLHPGENAIYAEGIADVIITPRWWDK